MQGADPGPGSKKLSDAELFAEFLENREIVAALRPWWSHGMTIKISQAPEHWADAEPFSVAISLNRVEDADQQVHNPHIVLVWGVVAEGRTLVDAARKAALLAKVKSGA